MNAHEFIFSKNRGLSFLRHLIFWLVCWIYLSLSYFFVQQSWMVPGINPSYVSPGDLLLLKTFLQMLIYMTPCYLFIGVILPSILDRKFVKAFLIILPVTCIMYASGWIMYWKIFPFVDSVFGLPIDNQYPTKFWPAIVLGLIDPLKIIVVATAITFIKQWRSKQKEKETIEKEKLISELKLLKAQISPGFLFKALDNIYVHAKSNSSRASELLMKLSDLLSYMIYDCEANFVPLYKEIEKMQDFIELEKLRLNNNIETGFSVNGDVKEAKIAPFILLPFIEFSLEQSSSNSEQPWVNIDVEFANNTFVMRMAGSITLANDDLPIIPEVTFADVQKRLSLLYPHKHELKISWESEMFIVLLKIETVPEMKNEVDFDQLILLT